MKKIFKLVMMTIAASFLIMQISAVLAVPPENSNAGGRGFGALWYEGYQVATFVPNGKLIKNPSDPLYAFPDQDSVIRYAPGDKEYNGGHWEVWAVTWNVAPYLIESYGELAIALGDGDISIVRAPENDVLCPVLPGKIMAP